MNKNTQKNEAVARPWLSIEEAAKYLGMGKTVLYTLTRQGKIPANRVGKKWTFEKDQLDKWVRSNQPIESFFTSLDFNIESNEALREPQRDAYLRVSEFFGAGKKQGDYSNSSRMREIGPRRTFTSWHGTRQNFNYLAELNY